MVAIAVKLPAFHCQKTVDLLARYAKRHATVQRTETASVEER
jgi:hypothetical protein